MNQFNSAVQRRDRTRFDIEILPLTVDQQSAFSNAHYAFGAFDRCQPYPLHDANGIEYRVGVKDPAAAGKSLALIERPPPARSFRQPQCGQALCFAVAMMMLGIR
ncbi:hypothetical protein D3C75_892720 [compost metagenome]